MTREGARTLDFIRNQRGMAEAEGRRSAQRSLLGQRGNARPHSQRSPQTETLPCQWDADQRGKPAFEWGEREEGEDVALLLEDDDRR